MRILGIDPGTAICGYGFVENVAGEMQAGAYGSVFTPAKMRMEDRLLKIFDTLDMLIKKYKPDVMGVEKLFFCKNVTTAIPVGQARGVVLLAAAKNNLPIIERTPMQIKQDVTGYGKASKQQVTYMVMQILRLVKPPTPDDTADALAIAIATAHCMSSFVRRNALL